MGKEQQALNPAAINGAETEEEIDLVEVFYLLWGHILQIIACFLAGALLAFGFTYFFVTPMYQPRPASTSCLPPTTPSST